MSRRIYTVDSEGNVVETKKKEKTRDARKSRHTVEMALPKVLWNITRDIESASILLRRATPCAAFWRDHEIIRKDGSVLKAGLHYNVDYEVVWAWSSAGIKRAQTAMEKENEEYTKFRYDVYFEDLFSSFTEALSSIEREAVSLMRECQWFEQNALKEIEDYEEKIKKSREVVRYWGRRMVRIGDMVRTFDHHKVAASIAEGLGDATLAESPVVDAQIVESEEPAAEVVEAEGAETEAGDTSSFLS